MNLRLFACIVPAFVALTSCGGDFGDTGDGDGSGGTGNLRLVNASRTGFLDLVESSTALTSSVPLSGAGTYLSIKRGTRTLAVRESGTTATLVSANVTVGRDDHQALVVYQSAGGSFQTSVLAEDEAAPAANSAKLRVFNTAQADAGNVDVYAVAATSSCADVSGSAQVPTIASVGTAPSGYVPLATATAAYRLCVTGAGVRGNLRLDIPALTLTNQRIVTLVLTRTPAATLQALTIDQQGAVVAITGTAPPPLP